MKCQYQSSSGSFSTKFHCEHFGSYSFALWQHVSIRVLFYRFYLLRALANINSYIGSSRDSWYLKLFLSIYGRTLPAAYVWIIKVCSNGISSIKLCSNHNRKCVFGLKSQSLTYTIISFLSDISISLYGRMSNAFRNGLHAAFSL